MAAAVPRRATLRVAVWAFHLVLPLAGLWLLLAQPHFDVILEHHGIHFGLVVAVAAVNVALGVRMSEVARRRADARLFLISLVFLSSAGFLLLHALATPQVLLTGRNAGFAIATPVGLLLAAVFAALSSLDLTREARRRHPARPGPAPGRAVHGAGRLGGGVAVRAATAGPRPARGGHPGPADRHGRRRGRPVHHGLGPLLPGCTGAGRR